MSDNLENMIAPHRPGVVDRPVATVGEVDLLAVAENEALAAGDAPDEGDIVFFAAAGGSSLSGSDSLGVGKAKAPGVGGLEMDWRCQRRSRSLNEDSPTNAALARSDTLATGNGSKVDLIGVQATRRHGGG